MNIFINSNFVDTHNGKVNILQLVHLITEDHDVILPEILSPLHDEFGVDNEDIEDGDCDHLQMLDGTLYGDGSAIEVVFSALYPNDYDSVIANLCAQLIDVQGTLNLDHNCLPVREVQTSFAFPTIQALEEVPAAVEPVEVAPFPETEEVLRPAVASLGTLAFDGKRIPTFLPEGTNGVVFDVEALYCAIYKTYPSQEHLRHLITVNASQFDPEDVFIHQGKVFLTVHGLSKVHAELIDVVEWYPMVMNVVTAYCRNPNGYLNLNLLGRSEG